MSGDDPGTRRLLLAPALGWLGTRLLPGARSDLPVSTTLPKVEQGHARDEHEQWVAELPDEIRKDGETKP